MFLVFWRCFICLVVGTSSMSSSRSLAVPTPGPGPFLRAGAATPGLGPLGFYSLWTPAPAAAAVPYRGAPGIYRTAAAAGRLAGFLTLPPASPATTTAAGPSFPSRPTSWSQNLPALSRHRSVAPQTNLQTLDRTTVGVQTQNSQVSQWTSNETEQIDATKLTNYQKKKTRKKKLKQEPTPDFNKENFCLTQVTSCCAKIRETSLATLKFWLQMNNQEICTGGPPHTRCRRVLWRQNTGCVI